MFPCLRRLFGRRAIASRSNHGRAKEKIAPSSAVRRKPIPRPNSKLVLRTCAHYMMLQTKPRQPDSQRNPETLAGPSLRSHSIQEPIVLQFFVSQHAKRNGFSRLSQSMLRGDQTLRPRGSELPLNRHPSTLRPSPTTAMVHRDLSPRWSWWMAR